MRYLHSDIDTLERLEIIRDLRMDVFDVLVGINLLREGLDIPEVSLVAILDADKEGFLRSETSLFRLLALRQEMPMGRVIMYADVMTESMDRAITGKPTAAAAFSRRIMRSMASFRRPFRKRCMMSSRLRRPQRRSRNSVWKRTPNP